MFEFWKNLFAREEKELEGTWKFSNVLVRKELKPRNTTTYLGFYATVRLAITYDLNVIKEGKLIINGQKVGSSRDGWDCLFEAERIIRCLKDVEPI